jgi:hypothetical protein
MVSADSEVAAGEVLKDVAGDAVVDVECCAHFVDSPRFAVVPEEEERFEVRNAVQFAPDELVDRGIGWALLGHAASHPV